GIDLKVIVGSGDIQAMNGEKIRPGHELFREGAHIDAGAGGRNAWSGRIEGQSIGGIAAGDFDAVEEGNKAIVIDDVEQEGIVVRSARHGERHAQKRTGIDVVHGGEVRPKVIGRYWLKFKGAR